MRLVLKISNGHYDYNTKVIQNLKVTKIWGNHKYKIYGKIHGNYTTSI
jgi:hypothetical protein